ncbi:Crp/Fnr family transcriptional regulator [Noviherbaspirillum galbum]|uniref:Crp/Fnr family transcriptional regulator n=1 Tax=Noviherbaspirillum galbum TaxID=2709383 RepID=A0A6B3SY93_9BURK|nr:Crp/Fnr family transcriptional regulator [Noviherbaspirillum galbum]NEX62869.1 Crp/Fnr family transcriptional regulator [Noviherbaspirillum galbum]
MVQSITGPAASHGPDGPAGADAAAGPADAIDKPALLRASWLEGFDAAVVRDAAACGTLRRVSDGELVHARGADADGFYTLARGSIRFTRTTADGHATTIAMLDAPNWFGEISLFDGLPRTHDAHAAGDAMLLFHARTDFHRLLARHPAIYARFARTLCLRLRATFDLVEEAAVAPLAQRLARRLLELAHIRPSIMNVTTTVRGRDVPLTQEELGHLLGMSRQTIAKQLRQWEHDGLVQARYGRISIKQPGVLTRLAYPDRQGLRAPRQEPRPNEDLP